MNQKKEQVKELLNKTADAQIAYAKEATWGEMDWHQIEDGLKYGRLIFKTIKEMNHSVSGKLYLRSFWEIKPAK